ncbi:hypothetical protein [Moraxella ovis]|uniref:hypothetical protein n=1 Tax=Moraxella ovis TaxID=29433 RepID=UPI0015EBE9C1|nr:hypothetical protein [Moraxella ovis]
MNYPDRTIAAPTAHIFCGIDRLSHGIYPLLGGVIAHEATIISIIKSKVATRNYLA